MGQIETVTERYSSDCLALTVAVFFHRGENMEEKQEEKIEQTTEINDDNTEVVLSQTQAPATAAPNVPLAWSYGAKGTENVRKARATLNTRHGMYSGVPIICRGANCPFRETCWIPDADLEEGNRCPIEVGAIMERYDSYQQEWGVQDDDTTDHSIIKDIIDIEITMLRADNALAISGDFIQEVVAGMDPSGRAIKRPEVHKALEVKSRLRAERLKLLSQMNSTRKDKKQEVAGLTDPSSIASSLMQKVRALQERGQIIDVTAAPAEEASE